MNLHNYRNQFLLELENEFPKTEADTFFNWLAESYLGMNRLQISLQPSFEISTQQQAKFELALKRLLTHEPIQYILGKCRFFELEFEVNSAVLIPRPETEELVEWILFETSEHSEMSVLDIGTGSGCIAISLAKNMNNPKVFAIDVSESALDIAKKNAYSNQVKINFIQQNLLNADHLPSTFDIIVSNPPYVCEKEKLSMLPNVLEYEPAKALFVPDDNPLIFYKKIAELAQKQLSKKGMIFLEINQYLGKETSELFAQKGFQTILKKDIFGNERMLKAWI